MMSGEREVSNNFEQNVVKLSEMFNIKNFFLAGGVTYRQKDKLRSLVVQRGGVFDCRYAKELI